MNEAGSWEAVWRRQLFCSQQHQSSMEQILSSRRKTQHHFSSVDNLSRQNNSIRQFCLQEKRGIFFFPFSFSLSDNFVCKKSRLESISMYDGYSSWLADSFSFFFFGRMRKRTALYEKDIQSARRNLSCFSFFLKKQPTWGSARFHINIAEKITKLPSKSYNLGKERHTTTC